MKSSVYDLFISHASEDKKALVQPLAESLRDFGVKVWYDDFTLSLGDSLSRSIDKGLASSSYGLVIISPDFLRKDWPEYELRGLVAREIGGKKVILPIWYGISRQDLLSYSPTLADKLAIVSSDRTPLQLAVEVMEVIRPDLFQKLVRRAVFLKSRDKGEKVTMPINDIKMGPPVHETLPFPLVSRVRLLRAALLHVYPHSMEYWMDGFRGDAHPSREVRIWEHVSSCYLEYVSMVELSKKQHKDVFNILSAWSCAGIEHDVSKYSESLPSNAFEVLKGLWLHALPIYDIPNDQFPSSYSATDDEMKKFAFDQEIFPHDLPDELVYQLLGQTVVEDTE